MAKLSAVLSIPLHVLSPTAANIMRVFGFAATVVDFSIPDYYVNCVKYASYWMAKDSNDTSNVVYVDGQMYVVNYQGETTRPTVEDYYPVSAFSTRDQGFAETICRRLWGYPKFRVTGWANG